MESNGFVDELGFTLESSFEVYDVEPYLPRIRTEYSYYQDRNETIECTVLVYQEGNLVHNTTATIHYTGMSSIAATAHSTFDLAAGIYDLVFTQRVLRADGTPTLYSRNVFVAFTQLQDFAWVEVSIQWDQYQLALLAAGIALVLIGIYVTDHGHDTPEEYERYQRRMNGERNYPYDWKYRRKMKRRK
jgi:hypothetical protein